MMDQQLHQDQTNLPALLGEVLQEAKAFLEKRETAAAAPVHAPLSSPMPLPEGGLGAGGALESFRTRFRDSMLASSGPHFYGFVIGGATPAALAGDWLTSLYDQNAFGLTSYVDREIELEAISLLKSLLQLPDDYEGVFTSGATMANFSALAVAREWAAQSQGKSADDGIYGLKPPAVLTGVAHASVYKGLSMLGMGRNIVTELPCLPGRECLDVDALETYLKAHPDTPCIVVANMGTVNSGDMDDLKAIAALKDRYDFYLHIEGAIGAVSAASPLYRPLFDGCERADSFTVDAHKWLNTTYDCGILLVRGKALRELQYRVFSQSNRVNGPAPEACPFFNLGPEGSRRMRALPAWFTLTAYGRDGYRELVERDCAMARRFSENLSKSPDIRLLHEVRLNVLSFTLNLPEEQLTATNLNAFSDVLRKDGVTYLNTAALFGKPVVRCAISNWMITEKAIDEVSESVIRCARTFCASLA